MPLKKAVILMEAAFTVKNNLKKIISRTLNSHISQIAQSFLSKDVEFLRSGNHTNFIRVT